MFHVKPWGRPRGVYEQEWSRLMKIPDGWIYCTSELDEDAAWALAIQLKRRREDLRPDLFVRVRVIPGYGRGRGSWWVLRKDEPRVKE